MQVRVKNTIRELPILIISNDPGYVEHLATQADFVTYHAKSASSLENLQQLLEQASPKVIVAIDEDDFTSRLFQELIAYFEIATRPILIWVSDDPSHELFSLADQVIPVSFLPHIEHIITAQVTRFQETVLRDKQLDEFKADYQALRQELTVAKQTSAEVNLLKQAIVHGVSHELRTPMLQVKSAVALLNEDATTNRTIVELAMEATTRLEGGIRNVTLLNELMNENSDVHSFTAVPIVHIIQAAVRNLGRSWEHKKEIGRVEIISTNNVCIVHCDKQRLTIAIQLLLDNALKFSRDKVTVEIAEHHDKVSVIISDRGIGIPVDQIKHIFEPFYQIDGSSTRRFGGMGIGLAIVQLILEQHYATIRIDSSEGKGSTFSFDLYSGEQ